MDHHRKQEVPSDTNTAKTPGAIAVNDFSPNTSQCPNQYGPRAKDDTFKQPAMAGDTEQQPGIHCQQKAGKDDSATFELNVRGWSPRNPWVFFILLVERGLDRCASRATLKCNKLARRGQ